MSELELRPGLEGVPCAESAVSFIDGQKAKLMYRGIAVADLARDSNFEETSWLLLNRRRKHRVASRRRARHGATPISAGSGAVPR